MLTELIWNAAFLTAIFALMVVAHAMLLYFAFRSDNGKDKRHRQRDNI